MLRNGRQSDLKRILMALISIVVVVAVASVWIIRSNSNFEETFFTMESYKIEEPVRVILLTDLHQKSFGDGNEKLLARIQALKPDAVLIAGDMVNRENADWDALVTLCEGLVKIAPVYYGLGNHENEALYGEDLNKDFLEKSERLLGDSPEDFTPLLQNERVWNRLEETGVELLQNESVTVEIKGNAVEIGGLSTNISSFWPYSGQFVTRFAEENTGNFKILISHRPEPVVEYISDTSIDLIVSGHNHGGIIRIPGVGGLISASRELFPEYDAGWFEFDRMSLLISRGLGGHGIVPRILNPPELVVLDIN